jgi:hypothetical protein
MPFLATLLQNGLGLLASAIMNKGEKVISDKLGLDLQQASLTAEGMQKLKQFEIDHEEFLVNAAIENRKLDIEEEKIAVDNTKSAREMNVGIETSANVPLFIKFTPYAIDIAIVCATIGAILLLFYQVVPEKNKELAYMAVGSLLTMCGTILNFHRGSSSGSKANQEANGKMVELLRSKS